jgi:hypothetical protein
MKPQKGLERAPPGSRIHSTGYTYKSHSFKRGLFCGMNNDEDSFHLLMKFSWPRANSWKLGLFFFFFNHFFSLFIIK